MSFEAAASEQTYTLEGWQMVCCRYYTAGRFVAGKRVLEVGCGTGRGLGYLAARAKRIVGVDYGQDNIQQAKQHYGNRIELKVADAQRLPFQDNSFDVVLAMEVIYYFTSLDRFLEECHRVLVDDGLLCLCLPNKDAPGFHASPLGRRYYSVLEMVKVLESCRFSHEVFGAFPIASRPLFQRMRSAVLVAAGRLLDKIPKTKMIKEFLRKVIYKELILNKPELEEGDMIPGNYCLEPVPPNLPDNKHRILYVTAHAE